MSTLVHWIERYIRNQCGANVCEHDNLICSLTPQVVTTVSLLDLIEIKLPTIIRLCASECCIQVFSKYG